MFKPLSPRQNEVLTFIAHGLTNKEIAAQLGIDETTVITHVENIFIKMNARNRAEAVFLGSNFILRNEDSGVQIKML